MYVGIYPIDEFKTNKQIKFSECEMYFWINKGWIFCLTEIFSGIKNCQQINIVLVSIHWKDSSC